MLHKLDIKKWKKVKHLFKSHMLAQSIINPCAHSRLGSLTVDDANSPATAMYSIPMMIFLAGESSTHAALELVKSLPPLTVFVVPDEKWRELLTNEWGDRIIANQRTHMNHKSLNIGHIRKLKEGLPEGYILERLGREVLPQINQEYTMQIQMYFGATENLVESGVGFCIMQGEKLVSFAYTTFPFIEEFEIQVFTEDTPEHRRKGLATVVSAALIEYGLERNLVPHWDAVNQPSVRLALKLGYSNPEPWEAYYYTPKKE